VCARIDELALMLERQVLIVGRKVSFGTLAAKGKLANTREMFLAGIGQRNGAGMAWRLDALLCAKTGKIAQKQTGRRQGGQRGGGRERAVSANDHGSDSFPIFCYRLRCFSCARVNSACFVCACFMAPQHPIANFLCAAKLYSAAKKVRGCSAPLFESYRRFQRLAVPLHSHFHYLADLTLTQRIGEIIQVHDRLAAKLHQNITGLESGLGSGRASLHIAKAYAIFRLTEIRDRAEVRSVPTAPTTRGKTAEEKMVVAVRPKQDSARHEFQRKFCDDDKPLYG